MPIVSMSKRVVGRNHSGITEEVFTTHHHFHMNGFALRLVLKQRQKVTRERPVRDKFDMEILKDAECQNTKDAKG